MQVRIINVKEEVIKSAFELAMERISGLPELTPQEIAEQKEKQFGPVGEAMAGKYLRGVIRADEMLHELERYEGEPEQIILRSLLSRLCGTLQLEGDAAAADKALTVMSRIFPTKQTAVEKAAEKFRALSGRFEQEREKKRAEMKPEAAERMGITGSAVRYNLDDYGPWMEEIAKLRQACEPQAAAIRNRLLGDLTSE